MLQTEKCVHAQYTLKSTTVCKPKYGFLHAEVPARSRCLLCLIKQHWYQKKNLSRRLSCSNFRPWVNSINILSLKKSLVFTCTFHVSRFSSHETVMFSDVVTQTSRTPRTLSKLRRLHTVFVSKFDHIKCSSKFCIAEVRITSQDPFQTYKALGAPLRWPMTHFHA